VPGRFRVPAEVLRPRSVPNRHSIGANSSGLPIRVPDKANFARFPFAVPFARRLRSCRTIDEIGIGLRLTLDHRLPFHRFNGLHSEECRPLPRWSHFRTSSVAGGPFLVAKCQHDLPPESRQADSGAPCLWITGISWISERTRAAAHWAGLDSLPAVAPSSPEATAEPPVWISARHWARAARSTSSGPVSRSCAVVLPSM
jgi:hypothetical protein